MLKLHIPPLLPFIQEATPVKNGAMRDSWHEIRLDESTILMTNKKPYAAIQVYGGFVPPYKRDPKTQGPMRAVIGGEVAYFYSRKGFTLPGHEPQFMDAIRRWSETIKVVSDE